MIVYLHGFRSAPASRKAQQLRQFMAARGLAAQFWCEQLPAAPLDALALVERVIAASPTPPTLVGSSLGGLYAAVAAQRHDLRAVLINPAVLASVSLEPYLGVQTNLYTGERFEFTATHLAQLHALEAVPIGNPARLWLLVEEGDEVLDYRAATCRFAGARQTVLPGGDHSFTRFVEYLPEILAFAGEGGVRGAQV